MDTVTFENLLNESESDYLDFKQDQYRFDGATEEEKSEILKDILAFANAWRRTDAYILVGVREVKGGRSQVVGISKHIDDASLQQFVNSKLQKPISFFYTAFEFEGKQVGIIHIPVQERPFYTKQKYGKVKPHVVYLRRGSSTDEAEPDEIARMGVASVSNAQLTAPVVDCEFSNPITRKLYGKEIEVTSTLLKVSGPIPNFAPKQNSLAITSLTNSPNRGYYRELFRLYDYQYLLKKVGIRLRNPGIVTAFNARLEIFIANEDVLFATKSDFPDRPRKYFDFLAPIQERVSFPAIEQIGSRLSIDKNGDGWLITITFGSIQPKAEDWLEEPIFIGSRKSQDVHFEAVIYADNAPDPIRVPLCVHFQVEEVVRTIDELELDHEQFLKKELDEILADEE